MANVLAVSAHLDDAVLSYGGQIASLTSAGHHVTVYTVFAGTPSPPYSPAAIAYHEMWDLSGDPVAPRREEDRRALSILGATPVHGKSLDAVYRRDERGEWLIREGLPTEHQGDEPRLVSDIATTLDELIQETHPDRMVTCAAFGLHVDHKRTRDAALMAAARSAIPLALWDDFPYVTWSTDGYPPPPDGVELSAPVAEPFSSDALAVRARAVQCYGSQLAMLEEDGVPIGEMFAEYCAAHASRYGVTGPYEVTRRVKVRHQAGGLAHCRPHLES